MILEKIKIGDCVWDDNLPELGEGTVVNYEDSLTEVHYPNVEETITYTEREVIKCLNKVENEHN